MVGPASRDHQARPRKAQTAYKGIRQDLLNAVFAPGERLPQRKELAARYGVCSRTLAVALDRLVADGLLVARTRDLVVPALPASPGGRSVIVLLIAGDPAGRVALHGPRTSEYLRELESACGRASVDLATVTYDDDTGTLHSAPGRADPLAPDPGRQPVLGFLVMPGSIRRYDPWELVHRLESSGRPVAVLDEVGTVSWPAGGSGRLTRLFHLTSGVDVGGAVGNYLLGLGHRSVAYISPSHQAQWSRDRLQGLRQAFAAAGVGQGVKAYTLNNRYSHELHLRKDFPALRSTVESFLDEGCRAIGGRHELVAPLLSSMAAHLEPAAEHVAYSAKVKPLLERALRDGAHTAWVGANDGCALECLDMLPSRGVDVPGRISLVGFDNTFEAFRRGLTSYDFNSAGAMQAMVGFVLRPDQGLFRATAAEPLVIQGHIAARHSVARAHGPEATR